jgi:hypothetical protein
METCNFSISWSSLRFYAFETKIEKELYGTLMLRWTILGRMPSMP